MYYLIIPFSILVLLFILVTLSRKKKSLRNIVELEKYVEETDRFFDMIFKLSKKYISHSAKEEFKNKWNHFYEEVRRKNFYKKSPRYETIRHFLSVFSDFESEIEKRNDAFVLSEIEMYDSFFSDIDGKSLDQQQRTVVVTDEDRMLVLAGAGSGKTLTIAAKVDYLCRIKGVHPEDILLISFTNKAADEMTARIQNKLNIAVRAVTFHKLGLEIISRTSGFRPDVFDKLDVFVYDFFENKLLDCPDLVKFLTEYFIYYLEIPETMDENISLGELYKIEKNSDLETLKSKYARAKFVDDTVAKKQEDFLTLHGEKVKSLEEIKIANYLFMNGINYKYEDEYPYESDDPLRKRYRPDFYLSDYNIYLEHFGITRKNTAPWLSSVEEKKYLDEIQWKRDFHKKNGTKLIETYSYFVSEGILFTELEKILRENGVSLKTRDFADIFENVYAKKSEKYFSGFITLCCTFISLFKSVGCSISDGLAAMKQRCLMMRDGFSRERNLVFLDIIKYILEAYQKYLSDNKSVDFWDMINEAAKQLDSGYRIHEYKYVIVDEYQDITRANFNLLNSVLKNTGAKLLCVGDDWQSIYRFAGSDVSLFTEFERYFRFSKILRIEKTYRNSQQLIDEASSFIERNPSQLHKQLRSDKHLSYPLVFWGYDDDSFGKTLELVVKKIIHEFGKDASILLLGRTNYDVELIKKSPLFRIKKEKGRERILFIPSPETPMSFLSVHKSKGLEADNVVLLNFKNDRLGFPNQIVDDKILDLVLTKPCDYPFDEERRLFYVAITRTKNRTFVLTDNKSPSVFFNEFNESESVCFVSIQKRDEDEKEKTFCPRCKTGVLLKVNKNGKSFVGCSNFPRCDYTVKETSILFSPKKCPECGGFLIKRVGKNRHWFVGCTNYPYCEYTEQLKQT